VKTVQVANGLGTYSTTSVNPTINGAGTFASQSGNVTATEGGYVEEHVGFGERVFVTGALRVDGASGFGHNVKTATYPKVSSSWLAYDDNGNTIRFRAAFGAAGQQPQNGAALGLYNTLTSYVKGVLLNGFLVSNPAIRTSSPNGRRNSKAAST